MEHVTKGEFDLALQAFTQVLEVYIQEHGESHPLTASVHHNLGTVHTKRAALLPEHTLHQRHCREQALQCFQAAARSARDCPSLGPSHPNVAVSLVRIGFLLLQSRQYRNAVITFEEALRIRTENFGPTHGLVANLYNNLGVCHMHLQHFPDGRKFLQQALDIQKELLGQGDDDSTALLELADTLCNIGGLNLEWIRRQGPDARHVLDAESAFLEALELRSQVLGEDHNPSENLHTIHNCAATYMANGRYAEAVSLLEIVVECQKTRHGELHQDVGSAVHNVGIAYLRMEEHYDAFQAFEEAVRVRKASLGREHPDVAVSLVKFGISLMLLQRHEDALWIFRDALSIRKQALGDLHPSNARICNNIGCVHVELGNLKEARKDFELALDIQRNALIRNPENGPMIFGASTTLQNLGYLYGKWDMYEKAAMVLRESLSVSSNCVLEPNTKNCHMLLI
eukprot:jgi/Psemu1/185315/e_gw1.48.81.1